RAEQKAKVPSLGAGKGIADPAERIRKMMAADDKAGEIARKVTWATLAYASHRLGEIAEDIVNIDNGMKWGFAWDLGPFETWDAIGVADSVAKMEAAGIQPAKWVKDMLATGRSSFYSDGSYWNGKAVPLPHSPRQIDLRKS